MVQRSEYPAAKPRIFGCLPIKRAGNILKAKMTNKGNAVS
jgi:hypothetical protein